MTFRILPERSDGVLGFVKVIYLDMNIIHWIVWYRSNQEKIDSSGPDGWKTNLKKDGVEISCCRPKPFSVKLVYRVGSYQNSFKKIPVQFCTSNVLGLRHENLTQTFFRFEFQPSGVKLFQFFDLNGSTLLTNHRL